MSSKVKATILTAAKFIFWSAVAAGVQWLSINYTSWHMPAWSVPMVGAGLKSLATWISTEEDQ